MSKRIAVNTRFLLHNRLEGLGRFTHEVLQRWVAVSPTTEFFFIFDREYHPSFIYGPNVTPVVRGPQARHWLLWQVWFDYTLPALLRGIKPDLFVSPDGYLSLKYPGKQLPVIHDLAFEHAHHGLNKPVLRYYRKFFPKFAKKANRIATVSEFSARDISNYYRINPEKIDVVYNGASQMFKPRDEDFITQTQAKYSEGRPFFLFIGALHPRKNIANLLRAFDIFKNTDERGIKLIIAGRKAWGNMEMETVYAEMQHPEAVLFTGRLKDTEIAALSASALASVNVSWLEGFGLPVLEAMQSGTPVICSVDSAMQEVAGDACLLADPSSPESIAMAMRKMAEDDALQTELKRLGLSRAKFFNWEKTAHLLWKSAEKAMQ